MKKIYFAMVGALLISFASSFSASAQYPEDLDGMKMAMEYRADNWDMFTNVKIDQITFRKISNMENAYRLDGMLGWYNNLYRLDSPLAIYDPAEGLLSVLPAQDVIARDDITWQICNMANDEECNNMPVMFRFDNYGILHHVRSTRIDGQGYTSTGFCICADGDIDPETGEPELLMLYMLLDPVIHPYNGKMTYNFVAQNGKEFAQSSVVYTFVHGSNLIIRNWSDTGFGYDVFFTIDAEKHTLTATNQAILFDPDMLGECTLSEADASGMAILDTDNSLVLRGTYTNQIIDGKEQTVATFPTWGCFSEYGTNFFVPTTNTKLYLGYDIANPPAGINTIAASDPETEAEYFTIEGIRVDKPGKGLYIVRKGGTTSKIIIK